MRDTAVQVIEIVPPYVRTGLQGERQARDPNAMPLEAFISEVMGLLQSTPDAQEILVGRVKPLRGAPASGEFDAFYEKFNAMMLVARTTK